jgi:hypothetical protein
MGLSTAQPGAAVRASSDPTYDEQVGTTFTQNFNALAYNVTALAQSDANGFGPAYLLNGITTSNYWYQVGISYHWPSSNGAYNAGFGFSYQVYGPNGNSVYPSGRGAGLASFSKVVNSGDTILLSLTFSGTTVLMSAQDWQTGATAKTSYGSVGSTSFVGSPSGPSNAQGFFTGLMTEWYHLASYSGNEGKVVYSNQAVALTSAWLWADEFNTGTTNSQVFAESTQTAITFANDQQVYPFESNGATVYGSAHQFITGLLNTATSMVSLNPATVEAASPSFEASYTIAGLQQSSEIGAGTGTAVEADPGTSITVTLNSSGSSPFEKWVFSGTQGSTVTFTAGSNVTYVYYHLVQEAVSYQVAGGGGSIPASSAPELTFAVPPSVASATRAQVSATQVLGTTPVDIFALVGSDASINATVPGAAGERWAATAQSWTISAPDDIPNPIQLYHQYDISVQYSIVGGGTPPQTPGFESTAFGSPSILQLSSSAATKSWLDAGSGYSFTSILNGSAPAERWTGSPGSGSALPTISSPDETLSMVYTHQYYANLAVNDATGGTVSQDSGWFDAGSNLNAIASASQGWQFENWTGTGVGAYNGTSPSIDVNVAGPLAENATFYVQLQIAADARTNIAYSSASGTGAVQAGSTKTIYVPPSSNVTLRATPSTLVYSFASWQGAGLANASTPSVALAVYSPSAVSASSTYNYPVILGAAATAALIVLAAAAILIRGRHRRQSLGGFSPV